MEEEKMEEEKLRVLRSGGAEGSDYAWQKIAYKLGWKVEVHTFGTHKMEPFPFEYEKILVSEDDLEKPEFKKVFSQGSKNLKKNIPGSNYMKLLMCRNFSLLQDVEAVFAVGYLNGENTLVDGGTGWSIEFAKILGIPNIFVFEGENWRRWDQSVEVFEICENPSLWDYEKVSGVGTRKLYRDALQNMLSCCKKS